MKIRTIFSVFCCVFLIQVTRADYDDYDEDPVTPPDTPSLAEVVSKNGLFSNNFVKALSSGHRNNYVSSPLSAWLALSMAYMGASGQTAITMREKLNLPEAINVTQQGFKDLMENLNAKIEDVELKIVNKLYVKQGSGLKEQFKQVIRDTFKVTAEERDFQDPSLPTEINNFVAEATNQKIKNILPQGNAFDSSTKMVLLNAVYFKGLWDTAFDKSHTVSRNFLTNGYENSVPTMMKEFKTQYASNSELGALLVEIPYKGKKTSMLVVVPQSRTATSLANVEEKIRVRDINNLMKTSKKRDIRLYLPKFRVESSLDLESTMTQMGLTNIFGDQADFSKISDQSLKVNTIRQKAFIQVDEESTEAAAVTDLGFVDLSAQNTPRFIDVRVDQPFLFYILHRTSPGSYSADNRAVVLFSGRVANPTNENFIPLRRYGGHHDRDPSSRYPQYGERHSQPRRDF